MSAAAACVNIKNFNLTLKMEQNGIPLPPPLPPKATKQGIVSILGSDSDQRNKAASIRRTLSADMSSKKWLTSNGFMKKIASSQELVNLAGGSSEPEPTSVDVWSSIISQKKQENSTLPPPYIHPLIKKTSSLTEKSLEICTESLGSETGSEIGFPPSYPPSETDQDEKAFDDHHQEILSQSFEEVDEIPVVKYNKKSSTFSSPPKSFPPPIPSLVRDDNPSVQMQSFRENGRLILEAVSIPPQNLFRAQRLDGRLLLSIVNTLEDQETEYHHHETEYPHQETEFDKVFDEITQETEYDDDLVDDDDDDGGFDDDGDEEEEEEEEEVEDQENGTKGMQIVLEKNPRLTNGGTTLMMKKKNNLTIPQSLPMVSKLINSPNPTSAAAAAASFNAYEYFWRKNPTTTIVNNYDDNNNNKNKVVVPTSKGTTLNANGTTLNAKGTTTNNIASYEQQDLVVMRGNKGNINYLVPLFKGCKEPRKSLLFWEPYCIATS